MRHKIRSSGQGPSELLCGGNVNSPHNQGVKTSCSPTIHPERWCAVAQMCAWLLRACRAGVRGFSAARSYRKTLREPLGFKGRQRFQSLVSQ